MVDVMDDEKDFTEYPDEEESEDLAEIRDLENSKWGHIWH